MNDGAPQRQDARIHVLIVSHDRVGPTVAGPGIRYRELARVLSRHFDVTLAVPGEAGSHTLPFDLWPYSRDQWSSLAPIAGKAEVIIACGDTLADFPALSELPTPLVVDGYDPHTLEALALWADQPLPVQTARHDERLAILRSQGQTGDFFICASERQRDWWLGVLELCGRINPSMYGGDPTLRRLIGVVPYGLPSELPQATRPVLRGVWPGIAHQDHIILWGGGLWEWLDPLTAVRAARHLLDRDLPLRLVFPGTRHPNRAVPEMPVRAETLTLADELGLTDRQVFFGDWLPYQDWPAVLLEADVGLSLHPDSAEARLAYRSRVLDYIWAGLPMVVTRGDVLSELVDSRGLGLAVDYGDDAGVADAIQALLQVPRSAWQERFAATRTEMTWERAARPLVEFCHNPRRTSDRSPTVAVRGKDANLDLAEALVDCEAEVARLRDLVAGYEQGRLMRLMRRVQRWREKVGA